MRRWSAVIIGFIGVLVIVQPGSTSFSVGTLVALSAAVLSAIVAIQIKQLSRVDPADTIVFYNYRSEARRVGQAWVSTCSTRRSPSPHKNTNNNNTSPNAH